MILQDKREKNNLLDPHGPLAQSVPSTSIAAANLEVYSVVESQKNKKRGQYAKYTPEQKSMIGKSSAEHVVVAAVCYYIRDFPNLKENIVRDWRNAYRLELRNRVRDRNEADINITELPLKKGHPLLLDEVLDKQVQAYLTSFRESGAAVNTAIAMACAEGIVRNADSNLVVVNGGHILITKDWAKLRSLLRILRRKRSSFCCTSKLLLL